MNTLKEKNIMSTHEILEKLYEYIKKSSSSIYNPEKVGYKSGYNDELKCIARFLCGIANWELAYDFMEGSSYYAQSFFDNVEYNGPNSNPIIRRAIEIHLMNRKN